MDLVPATTTPPPSALDIPRLLDMIRHWLGCPEGDYYGSDYGSPLLGLLHGPLADTSVFDAALAKLRRDVPPLGDMPPNVLSISTTQEGHDRRDFVISLFADRVRLALGGDGMPLVT